LAAVILAHPITALSGAGSLRPTRCRRRTDGERENIKKPENIKMSGGSGYYYWKTAIISAGIADNPDYGKMAADSIAKEVEERKLVPPTTRTEAVASSEGQVSPATGTDKITPSEDEGAGVRK
jgi:hypothetical protein